LNANTPGAIVILLVTVGVSLLGLYGKPKLIEASLFRPYSVVRNKRYYTLLSSGLVHNRCSFFRFPFPFRHPYLPWDILRTGGTRRVTVETASITQPTLTARLPVCCSWLSLIQARIGSCLR
jgi:hypothetical protein